MNALHDANRKYWQAISRDWQTLRDQDALWQTCPDNPETAFEPRVWEIIQSYTASLAGRSVCVLGSGDNYAAFALAGQGAKVTSVDISQAQLDVAAERTRQLGLDIEFIQGDISDMPHVPSERFDLACATNGVTVWLSDLNRYYAEVYRILQAGGHFISYDVHPFQRPWRDALGQIQMTKPYFDTGPRPSTHSTETGGQPLTYYNFHWTIGDILNAIIASGLQLRQVVEAPSAHARFWLGPAYTPENDADLLDWKKNPRAGLPVWLVLVAEKTANLTNGREK